MQYDAVFLLYQLRYSADYEERITVKCHILSHKANNSPFCNELQLRWEKNLKFRLKIGGK